MERTNTRGGEYRRGSARQTLVRRMLAILVAVVVVLGTGSAVAGCTFEFGGGPGTTIPAASGTTLGEAIDTTTTTISVTDTTAFPSSGSVVERGDGMASPAQRAAAILGPSVVNIAASGTAVYSQGPFRQQYEYSYEGSGVIYTAGGMIITNNHVVSEESGEPVDKIEVTLATGEKLPATLVGADRLTDLAIIKVEAAFDLPVATFVTEPPSIGEYAVAIGSPLGYENSVSMGIISGLNRSIDAAQGYEGIALTNLIQTDAPISPGNSGGALGNAAGQVIGINVAYEPPQTGAVNIGFAIPSVVVVQVADQIISTGRATHSYMGVGTRTVTPALQQQFGLSRSSGILVAEVTRDGPAGKAGIQRGDIIFKVNDRNMVQSSDLIVAIRDKRPGDVVQVALDRGGTEMTIAVTLEERPSDLQ